MSKRMTIARTWWLYAAALTLTVGGVANAQTGVSDDRVSLPEGPGSLEGIGDDVEIDPNMGAMSYSVGVFVPGGFPGLTPNVSLSYSSGAGSSVVGMGWSLPSQSVERLTLRGVPEYDTADEFEVDMGDQLVLVETVDDTQIYRSRFEQGFVRYTWHDVGDGTQGYWTAEYPDGRVAYYGVNRNGNPIASARVAGPDGTFRYLLVEEEDVWGHRVEYTYGVYGSTSLLEHIGYVFTDGDPVYEVDLTYGDRADWISNATGGFEEVLDQRLEGVSVSVRGTRIRRYALSYQDYETSGRFTRLSEVQMYGVDDSAYPVSFTFDYSRSLGAVCDGVQCERPFIVSMGNIGVNLQNGRTQLLDINGDALPDIVDASLENSPHRFFYNTMTPELEHSFTGPEPSEIGSYTTHNLQSAFVKTMDVNGDGFTDLINATNASILINRGTGDWDENLTLSGGTGTINSIGEAALQVIRFLDYDNDRRIDLIASSGSGDLNTTTVYRNMGDEGFQAVVVDSIGAGFDSDAIELNDMNGDGLLDVVQVLATEVRYRINLGWGNWTDWRTAGGNFDFNTQQSSDVELEDLNGDALSDLVLVEGDTVRVWINENGRTYGSEQVITADEVDGSIPENLSTTTVLFADMNGNGSSDVVWITSGGDVTYLELYPVRPNLISRIENGLGLVIDVTYGTSVEHMARDGVDGMWAYRIPFPNIVVDELDEWDRLTMVHRISRFTYHDGYYDGVEKVFRGFESVERALEGDESQQPGEVEFIFDLGVDDPYFAGLKISEELIGDGTSLQLITSRYDDCDVAGIPAGANLLFDVRFICLLRTDVDLRDSSGGDESAQLRTENTYDGYGNVTLQVDHGIVSIGGAGCGVCDRSPGETGLPCGEMCLGDERYTESAYVSPDTNDGRWLLNLISSDRTYAVPGSDTYTEILNYYDGEAYVGLELGRATHGYATRVVQRLSEDGTSRTLARSRHDDNGNTVEEIDALGTPGGDDHRRLIGYDDDGLRVSSIDVLLTDSDGVPYSLQQDVRYDQIWDEVSVFTNWRVIVDGEATTPVLSTIWGYDVFGRITSVVQPGGDTVESPTTVFTYELGSPSTRIVASSRSAVGGAIDHEKIYCMDGRGRNYQERQMLGTGSYEVTGFSIFNVRGDEQEVFQPYHSTSAQCDDAPPEGTLSALTMYDVLSRPIGSVPPEGAGMSTRLTYAPMAIREYLLNDEDESSPHYDTPTISIRDGLERLVAVGRTLERGAEPQWYTFTYSETDDLMRVTDPEGNERVQISDLVGRVLSVDDPDRGDLTFEYDDLDNLLRETNPTSAVVHEYDGAGRVTADYDEADDTTRVDYVWDTSDACPTGLCQNSANQLIGVLYSGAEGSGADWWSFNERQLMTDSVRIVGSAWLELKQRYDNLDRIVGWTFPGDETVDFTVNSAGRITSVPGYIDTVTFDDRGDVVGMDFVNGVSVARTLDARRRQSAFEVTDDSGSTLLDFAFSFDAQSWLVGVADNSATGTPTSTAAYTYDAFGRLVEAALDGGTTNEETLTYVYDGAENLISRISSLGSVSPVHDGERTIAAAHQVVSAGGQTYAYDAAGRMVTSATATHTWDAMGRLSTVVGNDGTTVEYLYGRGIERTLARATDGTTTYFLGSDFVLEDGVASLYVRFGDETVARLEYARLATEVLTDLAPASGDDASLAIVGDGAINAGDAWLAFAEGQGIVEFADTPSDLSSVDALLMSSARRGLLGDDGERRTFLHRDQLDNLVGVTDDTGALVERTTYYPYGSQRWSSTQSGELFNVTDKRTDPNTGLVDFGLRNYDPHLARWIQPDRVFARLTVDDIDERAWEAFGGYVYGMNSPLMIQDETGGYGINTDMAADRDLAIVRDYFTNFIAFGIDNDHQEAIAQEAIERIWEASGNPDQTDVDVEEFVLRFEQDMIEHLELSSDDASWHGDDARAARIDTETDQFTGALEMVKQQNELSDSPIVIVIEKPPPPPAFMPQSLEPMRLQLHDQHIGLNPSEGSHDQSFRPSPPQGPPPRSGRGRRGAMSGRGGGGGGGGGGAR